MEGAPAGAVEPTLDAQELASGLVDDLVALPGRNLAQASQETSSPLDVGFVFSLILEALHFAGILVAKSGCEGGPFVGSSCYVSACGGADCRSDGTLMGEFRGSRVISAWLLATAGAVHRRIVWVCVAFVFGQSRRRQWRLTGALAGRGKSHWPHCDRCPETLETKAPKEFVNKGATVNNVSRLGIRGGQ